LCPGFSRSTEGKQKQGKNKKVLHDILTRFTYYN
jgi:hypothetical protein